MVLESNNPYADENICYVLVESGLLAIEQAEQIIRKKSGLKKTLQNRLLSLYPGVKVVNSVSIIDIIASLHINRADNPALKLDEETMFRYLAKKWGYPYKKINPLELDLNLVTTTIPRSFAMKHLILPIGTDVGKLIVATPNPFNVEIMDDISRVTHLKVVPVISSKSDVIRLINEFFGFKRSIAEAEQYFSGSSVDLGNLEQYVRVKSADEIFSHDQHIVNAVNHLFSYAFDQRASDIHIEPKRDSSLVRMRIDGVLHTVYKLPKSVHSAIVSRIKILSRLDMTEKRKPQDGRIKTAKADVEVEIRVSTIPVAFGEKVVMRVMDPDILFQDLENLGFSSTELLRYNQFIRMPHGIVLVTGPTGSGKSTTLYSTLRDISTPELNITTVEDPIEMINEDFNQIAVQPAINITFGTILRNILRQDPDIIMIGEMRDLETAENAVQAALTGHLVLSTLHTNDAPTSITRLLDLGVPAFLIQSTLIGVIAQRLVRKICKYCKEEFVMSSNELINMGLNVGKNGSVKLWRGKGCQMCRGTGYHGRTGVFEILQFTEGIKRLTKSDADLEAIRQKAREEGMASLRESAVSKLLSGKTTYQEVLRVTWEGV
ncbi:Type II secretion system protein [Desulfonema limicola]|uniref:Type II secretion system protein n=1 Tax=Desulfonema limicola TaxID=45656 RepID=A0A975B797_9BACT|nr:GspE/PulE family protein [Desulfonema limicola]QTA79850.1 Type II secretion system protein [Desulfonema limicola]